MYDDFHYPQPEHGMYDVATDAIEQVKWLYHYRFNQLEIAQPGSGLEELFAGQDLAFPEGDGTAKRRVSLTCGGDLLAVDVLVPANTEHLFDGIADFYCTADIVSANLESTIASNKPTGRTQPAGSLARMNTSSEMFQRFRDQGRSTSSPPPPITRGLGRRRCRSHPRRVAQLGCPLRRHRVERRRTRRRHRRRAQRHQSRPAHLHHGPQRYQPPADQPWLVNEVRFNDAVPAPDYTLVQHHIAAAKAKGADYIIAYCHWGWEPDVPPSQRRTGRPHTYRPGDRHHLGQPPLRRPAHATRHPPGRPDGLIVYAFGDFVCYHPGAATRSWRTPPLRHRPEDTSDGKRTYLANLQMLPVTSSTPTTATAPTTAASSSSPTFMPTPTLTH